MTSCETREAIKLKIVGKTLAFFLKMCLVWWIYISILEYNIYRLLCHHAKRGTQSNFMLLGKLWQFYSTHRWMGFCAPVGLDRLTLQSAQQPQSQTAATPAETQLPWSVGSTAGIGARVSQRKSDSSCEHDLSWVRLQQCYSVYRTGVGR